MERLNLSEKPAHSLQESAIHCARYAKEGANKFLI